MRILTRLLLGIILATSFCFGASHEKAYASGIQMWVRNILADRDLDVEVVFDEKTIQLLKQTFKQSVMHPSPSPLPLCIMSEVEPLSKSYQSDFKMQLKMHNGEVLPINGTYKCFKHFQIASKEIPQGSIIKKGHVKVVRLEYSKKQDVVTNKDEIVGMEALETIRPNVPIPPSSLIQSIIIKEGAKVDAFVWGRQVPLKEACVALESGRFGQIIGFCSVKTNKISFGMVCGPNRLWINPNESSVFEITNTPEAPAPEKDNPQNKQVK